MQLSVVQWIRRRAAAALRLGCASADGAAMAAEDAAELERVLDDLKRQLPEGHALAAVIADEELDFEQVLELTLDELSQARIVLSSVVSCHRRNRNITSRCSARKHRPTRLERCCGDGFDGGGVAAARGG